MIGTPAGRARGRKLAREYPCTNKKLFKAHCIYHKHIIMEAFKVPTWTSDLCLGRCSCGALFFVTDGRVFPIWQMDLKRQAPAEVFGAAHAKWSDMYWSGMNRGISISGQDIALMDALGLDDTDGMGEVPF